MSIGPSTQPVGSRALDRCLTQDGPGCLVSYALASAGSLRAMTSVALDARRWVETPNKYDRMAIATLGSAHCVPPALNDNLRPLHRHNTPTQTDRSG